MMQKDVNEIVPVCYIHLKLCMQPLFRLQACVKLITARYKDFSHSVASSQSGNNVWQLKNAAALLKDYNIVV